MPGLHIGLIINWREKFHSLICHVACLLQESADYLAVQVGAKVHKMADGIGELPSI